MRCVDIDDLAAELALGLVDGPARAEAFAHIDGCQRCRVLVDELAASADDLVLLAPPAEPAAGFEQRVLTRLQPVVLERHRTPRRRSARGVFTRVAAAAAVVVVLVIGFALGRVGEGDAIAAASMRTATGRVVGQVYLNRADPAWVFVAVPGWTDRPATEGGGEESYRVQLTMSDGRTEVLAGGDMGAGHAAFGTVIQVDPHDVRSVALVGDDGTAWCSADI